MTKEFNVQECKDYVGKVFDQVVVKQISDFIAIPNTSKAFDPDFATNGLLQKAAEHIKTYVQSLKVKGCTCEIIKHEGYTPLIFTQVAGDITDRTIFFYGHFDKQPHMTGWDENKHPIKPVIENGKLYGRGGADDGYSTYSSMLAIKACQEQNIPIPRCVMVTEGDEESGGHIDYYIEALKERIGNPEVIFCLDSGTYDYERLWVTNSLRGYAEAQLTVKNLREGVHSGDSSGIVPNVFRIANLLVQRLQNLQTGRVNEAFHVDIPPNRYAESLGLSEIITKAKGDVREFPFHEGVKPVTANIHEQILNRTWRPQLTVTGLTNLSPVESAGNVMIPSISMRLSMRLPPTKNRNEAEKHLSEILGEKAPFNAQVEVSGISSGSGWNAPDMSKWLDSALNEASEQYYGFPKGCMGEGGSIPLMGLLSDIWPKAQFVITGVLGPASNAHGPNEFLHLEYCKKLTQCMAHVLAKAHLNK